MSWDPQTNAEQRAAERAEKEKAPPLDPPWPYRLVAFDPFAFGVDQDPPEPPIDNPAAAG